MSSQLAVLFPGQGSQHTGMGQFLYKEFPVAKQTFEEASDKLSISMTKLCFEEAEAELNLTENTQPALLTVSIATYRVLKELVDLAPLVGAGHSVGEYGALVANDTLDFATAVALVRARGQFMQEAVPVGQGGMMAILGLTPEKVQQLCSWALKESDFQGVVAPANFNSQEQTVISGSKEVLGWIKTHFSAEDIGVTGKVRLIPLRVSAPFHCAMMQPAEDQMRTRLQEIAFAEPSWDVVQNLTAQVAESQEQSREWLTKQITGAVQWVQSMETLLAKKPAALLECGSGSVLRGLLKKIDTEERPFFNIHSLEDLKDFEQSKVLKR